MTKSADLPQGKLPVLFNWEMSSFFGWGVYGLNLALNWSRHPQLTPLTACGIDQRRLAVSALEARSLQTFTKQSADLQAQLSRVKEPVVTFGGAVLHALGNNLAAFRPANGKSIWGRSGSFGVFFLENTAIAPEGVEAAKRFRRLIAGSTWNAEVAKAAGLTEVSTILQGVDVTSFHPAPRADILPDRFLVFSGGKLEYRKGQDLVLRAFRAFAQRHPEALLVTAWHSNMPAAAEGVARGGLVTPVPFTGDGQIDVLKWAADNGVAEDRVIDLGRVPNSQMPRVLREMDVAVFPNRAEGGTNLVAMECMACGVPTILSANTGHMDLIADDNCLALRRQSPIASEQGAEGWGESDVEEIVESLELCWRDRARSRSLGAAAAAGMATLSWKRQTDLLADEVLRSV